MLRNFKINCFRTLLLVLSSIVFISCGSTSNKNEENSSSLPSYWAKTYGGLSADIANSIKETPDGGYVVTGYTDSFENGSKGNDFWVLKLASSGDVMWQKTYGGSGGDEANAIISTKDGGYAVAGYTDSFKDKSKNNNSFWVLKLDNDGDIVWQKTYGGSNNDIANSIIATSDGGYAVAGSTDSFKSGSYDFWVLKLDKNGDVIWQEVYGGSNSDEANSIIQTKDGKYIVAGYTNSFGAGNYDLLVLKLDENGSIMWQKAYGGEGSDIANDIIQTQDGKYVVAGFTDSFKAGSYDFWVLKIDENGSIMWQKAYGGKGNNDIANSITKTSDGGYAVAGFTDSFGAGSYDFWVLKLDGVGNVVWQKAYGGSSYYYDIANSIIQTTDGKYVVAGYTKSFGAKSYDFWILKLGSDGNLVWQKAYESGDSAEVKLDK